MAEWEDYSGDEWLRPSSDRETRLKVSEDHGTRGIAKRPRLEKPPWDCGDQVAGFELINTIGCGSHGWVFRGREISTGRIMALKVFPSVTQKEAARAKTGFRRMSKLRHRGLVRLHNIIHDEESLAFSMEHIDGCNMVDIFRQWALLPLQEACERLLEMIRQIGSALAWMHAQQLVHRDIKPTNLMLTRDGKRFVIIDCDLTGKFEAEVDPENIRAYLIWTPMYVAPEVLFRQSYCPASDIFSLGMVVLEALRLFSSHVSLTNGVPETDGVPETTAEPATCSHSESDEAIKAESRPSTIPRDDQDSDSDRGHIIDALTGLDPSVPEVLTDTVNEMLSPSVSDRPTAMSLTRLGRSVVYNRSIQLATNQDSARAKRITKIARQDELSEIQRWCHLVLGGQVQRLHIEGSSGIGKTTLLEIALAELRKISWANVLTARCQRFEQRPLQAFSQIADEIVMEFRRGNMGRFQVDSVSESILQRSLPGFNEVLEVDWSEPPVVTSPTRPGGLDAAMKVCNQIRRLGPLFFVIDDVQWADSDTVNVLDHLQSTIDHRIGPPQYQGLGLITVSRCDGDQQLYRPDVTVSLGPLSSSVTTEAIRSESEFQHAELTEDQIESLDRQIEGLPYRLEVYLSELSPSGILTPSATRVDSSDSFPRKTPTIAQVWQYRSDLLDHDVRQLLDYLVIAGRQVTFAEMQLIIGQENSALLETQLDELNEKRLIIRDGADGQYLRVWHDQLGQQLVHQIEDSERVRMHQHWAECLASDATVTPKLSASATSGQNEESQSQNQERSSPDQAAGRIAEHFDKAGQVESFVLWAKIAANQAQNLYAHIEAARWHRIVSENVDGEEKNEALRMAAEALERGGRLHEAAFVFVELSERLTGQAKLDAELNQVHCFIRSGRFNEITDRLQPLLKRLELPGKKSALLSKCSIVRRIVTQKFSEQVRQWIPRLPTTERSTLQSNQISTCLRLIRPLSYIDNWLSAELSVFSGDLVKRVGTKEEKIEILVGECVFNSYQPGRARRQAMALLQDLDSQLDEHDEPARHGDVNAGLAWAYGMAGQFQKVPEFIAKAREGYLASENYHGFEIGHTSYIESTSYFQIGNFESLNQLIEDMQAECATTNDRFILAMGTLGHASAVFLARDDIAGLQKLSDRVSENLRGIGVDGFAMVSQLKTLLLAIYQNRPNEIAATIHRTTMECKQAVTYQRVQIIKTLIVELTAIAILQLLPDAKPPLIRQFKKQLRILRRQELDAATLKADLIEGIAMSRHPECFGESPSITIERSKWMLKQASQSANVQGLIPAAMVAEDELDRLNGNDQSNRLIDFLKTQGITKPEDFARLYGG